LLDEQHANRVSIHHRVCRGLLRIDGILDDRPVRDPPRRRWRSITDDTALPEPAVGLPVDDHDRVGAGNEAERQHRSVFSARGAQARRQLLPPREGAVTQQPPIPDGAVDAIVGNVDGVIRAEHRPWSG
jgi:hypothetical protein